MLRRREHSFNFLPTLQNTSYGIVLSHGIYNDFSITGYHHIKDTSLIQEVNTYIRCKTQLAWSFKT